MDAIARDMQSSGSDQDMAVILLSTHGAMFGDEFYLVPFGVDPAAIDATSVSATEFARKVRAIAERGKVLLLLDACHSGAVGLGRPDASVLRNAVNMDTVTVLTSSKKDESSIESPAWKHGAFTRAFLDALSGAADKEGRGAITMAELASAMDTEVAALTRESNTSGRT